MKFSLRVRMRGSRNAERMYIAQSRALRWRADAHSCVRASNACATRGRGKVFLTAGKI
jgi:hypothetical protein